MRGKKCGYGLVVAVEEVSGLRKDVKYSSALTRGGSHYLLTLRSLLDWLPFDVGCLESLVSCLCHMSAHTNYSTRCNWCRRSFGVLAKFGSVVFEILHKLPYLQIS